MSDLTLIGLGAMGTALARTWLAAGHRPTVWNRTRARAEDLGAPIANTPAEAVAASGLVVVCLLDDASVAEALTGVDLTGKDLVNLTTCTPSQARARADWATARGARYLDGGIMAIPPMIGTPAAYVFYSGSAELFTTWEHLLAVPAGTRYVGADPGHAALHDIALLSAMYGMFAGISHAFALIRTEPIRPTTLAPLLAEWLTAMAGSVHQTAAQLESGDYREGVVSNAAMQAAGVPTFLRTAEEQSVSPELLTPYFTLLRRLVADGRGEEDVTGVVDLLR